MPKSEKQRLNRKRKKKQAVLNKIKVDAIIKDYIKNLIKTWQRIRQNNVYEAKIEDGSEGNLPISEEELRELNLEN